MYFRQATLSDFPAACEIITQAVDRMLAFGRRQWSADYPADTHIFDDITAGRAYVMTHGSGRVVAYGAVCYGNEPAYDDIDGRWLTDTSTQYVVVHRLAVASDVIGRGLGRMFLEAVARMAASRGIGSFRIDTNHDNAEMLALLSHLQFEQCGTVGYEHGRRIAFEKLI